MRGTTRVFVEQLKHDKVRRNRLISALCVLSLLVAIGVFWQLRIEGITLATGECCGLEEHQHSEGCYDADNVLTCEFEEHIHDIACYSDPNADTEDASIWEATLPKEVSGVWGEDVVSVAQSQLGYTESERNYILSENGDKQGYTRYGAWYGNPYGEWDSMFVAFCLKYAGVPSDVAPVNSGTETMRAEWESVGRYQSDNYIPSVGDIIFIDNDENGVVNAVGIVTEVNDIQLSVILGNSNQCVESKIYDINDSTIAGFGVLSGTPEVQDLVTISYVNENGVEFTAVGYMPENSKLVINELLDPERQLLIDMLDGYMMGDDFFAYDIEITADGEVIEITDNISITIDGMNISESVIAQGYYFPKINEEDIVSIIPEEATFAMLDTEMTDNGIEFELDSLSVFCLGYVSLDEFESTAEQAEGTNWIKFRDMYLESLENGDPENDGDQDSDGVTNENYPEVEPTSEHSSDVQIIERGGEATPAPPNQDDDVTVSKTISGTDIENVFDITLQVETSQNFNELYNSISVVVVMDVSNTMNYDFGNAEGGEGLTRYEAAMLAAEGFIDSFASTVTAESKVGFVAFNTHGHEIFGLQSCVGEDQADELKQIMRDRTSEIVYSEGYGQSHDRFTNFEAGLKMANDMLALDTSRYKFVIFISDGMPTTYLIRDSEGNPIEGFEYTGYDPFTQPGVPGTDGIFHDAVFYESDRYCWRGTDYSDKAAVRAREQAAVMKEAGIEIYSVGVAIGAKTIQDYVEQYANSDFSTIDIVALDENGNTEIGHPDSAAAYKEWLKTIIGSNHYGDSTDYSELQHAYDEIFETIYELLLEVDEASWTISDPVPGEIEFIGFYDKDQTYLTDANDQGVHILTGVHFEGRENTVNLTLAENRINWDLKKSGYALETIIEGDMTITMYTYTLVYRVRLMNEESEFEEWKEYDTNGITTLQYQTVIADEGSIVVSEPKFVEFPIPSVQGYLSEFSFYKVDNYGRGVGDAEFTLIHDTENCSHCRGDHLDESLATSVSIDDFVAVSDENGVVTFVNIPSGHNYTLVETEVPSGYIADNADYRVGVHYDDITLTVDYPNDDPPKTWNPQEGGEPFEIVNFTSYELPSTDGIGTQFYTYIGMLIMALPVVYGFVSKRKQIRGDSKQS